MNSAIRRAFERASTTYEAAAVLQSRVGEELLDRLQSFRLQPRVVLDLGAGTGKAAGALKRRYRRALVIALDLAPGMLREARRHQPFLRRFERVCADAARVPIAAASVDVVFSSLMLQWCQPPDAVLREIRRILRPDGLFAFASFGPDTLKELRSAWAAADAYEHINPFIDVQDLGTALLRAGLMEPVLDVDRVQLTYPDTFAVMRDLRRIGANHVMSGRFRGLTGRARMARVQAAYEALRQGARLPATFEVIYGAAWGATGHPPPSIEGEAHIAVSAIRRREAG
ncbi:MAG TPA: malonyl-ACP O-methyltransferase BioC [Steroidobacteraceae bacterium]